MQFVETVVTDGNYFFYERWTATDIMQPHNRSGFILNYVAVS